MKKRLYEVSLWTILDDYIATLKYSDAENKGIISKPIMKICTDGTLELTFSVPLYIYEGAERIENPVWYRVNKGSIIANMHKIKVCFNKSDTTIDERKWFEFLITEVKEVHKKNELSYDIKCEGLAFHELGKIGYKISLSADNFYNDDYDWFLAGSNGTEPKATLDYWMKDVAPILTETNAASLDWVYWVTMDWSAYADGSQRNSTKIYEEPHTSAWSLTAGGDTYRPAAETTFKEKERMVEISESNKYNITLKIAETFGVFCRYVYIHDLTGHITGRRIVFYNNFMEENAGYIDFTYPYQTTDITRTIDSTDLITKMFVRPADDSTSPAGIITILDVEANLAKEDYIFNFDYLEKLGVFTEEHKTRLKQHQANLHRYNIALDNSYNLIMAWEELLPELKAEKTLLTSAVALDKERITTARDLLNSLDVKDMSEDGMITISEENPRIAIMLKDTSENAPTDSYYIKAPDLGIQVDTLKIYQKCDITAKPSTASNATPGKDSGVGYDSGTSSGTDTTSGSESTGSETSTSTEQPSSESGTSSSTETGTGTGTGTGSSTETELTPGIGLGEVRTRLEGEVTTGRFVFDEYGNLTKITNLYKDTENSSSRLYLTYKYSPKLYSEIVEKTWTARLKTDQVKLETATALIARIEQDLEHERLNYDETLAWKNKAIKDFENEFTGLIREGYWQPQDYNDYGDHFENKWTIALPAALGAPISIAPANADNGRSTLLFDSTAILPTEKYQLTYLDGVTTTEKQHAWIDLSPIITNSDFQNNLDKISFVFPITNDAPAISLSTTSINLIKYLVFSIGSQCQYGIVNQLPALILTGDVSAAFPIDANNNPINTFNLGGVVILKTPTEGGANFGITTLLASAALFGETGNLSVNSTSGTYHYLRIQINSLNLKSSSDLLFIKFDGKIVKEFEDYYILTYLSKKYITFKPEAYIKLSSSQSLFGHVISILYALSNANTAIYLDALQVLKENSLPKVSYTINPAIIDDKFYYTAYNKLSRIVNVNDTDLKFKDMQGYIYSMTLDLDKWWQDKIEVKNYKTKFEDLFSTIVASTEAMKKSEYTTGLTSGLFSGTGGDYISSDIIKTTLHKVDLSYAFNNGTLTIDEENGIWGVSDSGVVAFRGGGIFTATEKDENGGWIWNTGIIPQGINADLIVTGQLDTNKIKVYAGDRVRFLLNGDGLFGYKSFLQDFNLMKETDDLDEIAKEEAAAAAALQSSMRVDDMDTAQYTVFNDEGLFLVARKGALILNRDKTGYFEIGEYLEPLTEPEPIAENATDTEKGVYNSAMATYTNEVQKLYSFYDDKATYTQLQEGGKKILDNFPKEGIKRVSISWDGLTLRNYNNERVFYADPDTGNLFLRGSVYADGFYVFSKEEETPEEGDDSGSSSGEESTEPTTIYKRHKLDDYLTSEFEKLVLVSEGLSTIFTEAGAILKESLDSIARLEEHTFENETILEQFREDIKNGLKGLRQIKLYGASSVDIYTGPVQNDPEEDTSLSEESSSSNNPSAEEEETPEPVLSVISVSATRGIWIGSERGINLFTTQTDNSGNPKGADDDTTNASVSIDPSRILFGVNSTGSDTVVEMTKLYIILGAAGKLSEQEPTTNNINGLRANTTGNDIASGVSGVKMTKEGIWMVTDRDNNRGLAFITPDKATIGTTSTSTSNGKTTTIFNGTQIAHQIISLGTIETIDGIEGDVTGLKLSNNILSLKAGRVSLTGTSGYIEFKNVNETLPNFRVDEQGNVYCRSITATEGSTFPQEKSETATSVIGGVVYSNDDDSFSANPDNDTYFNFTVKNLTLDVKYTALILITPNTRMSGYLLKFLFNISGANASRTSSFPVWPGQSVTLTYDFVAPAASSLGTITMRLEQGSLSGKIKITVYSTFNSGSSTENTVTSAWSRDTNAHTASYTVTDSRNNLELSNTTINGTWNNKIFKVKDSASTELLSTTIAGAWTSGTNSATYSVTANNSGNNNIAVLSTTITGSYDSTNSEYTVAYNGTDANNNPTSISLFSTSIPALAVMGSWGNLSTITPSQFPSNTYTANNTELTKIYGVLSGNEYTIYEYKDSGPNTNILLANLSEWMEYRAKSVSLNNENIIISTAASSGSDILNLIAIETNALITLERKNKSNGTWSTYSGSGNMTPSDNNQFYCLAMAKLLKFFTLLYGSLQITLETDNKNIPIIKFKINENGTDKIYIYKFPGLTALNNSLSQLTRTFVT